MTPIGTVRLPGKDGQGSDIPVFNIRPTGQHKPSGNYVFLERPIEDGTTMAKRGGRLCDEKGRVLQELAIRYAREGGVVVLTLSKC